MRASPLSGSPLSDAAKPDEAAGAHPIIVSLAQFRWKSRVIVIFADQDNSKAARQENQLMADRAGLEERDIVVLKIAGHAIRQLFGASADIDIALLARELASRHEGPPPGAFAAFLVGKDGTVKLDLRKPITTGELFAIIDAMPMRAADTGAR